MTTAIALLALALTAQEATIDADRPHVGTGPHVVAPGEVQFELGVQWQGWPDSRTFGSPALIRIGVADRLELRVSSDGLLARYQPLADVYGVGNAQLGAKIRVFGDRAEPWFSLLPMVGFGLASREKGLGAGATDATVTWLVGREVRERVNLEANYGVGAIGDSAGHFAQHLVTGAVVYQTTPRVCRSRVVVAAGEDGNGRWLRRLRRDRDDSPEISNRCRRVFGDHRRRAELGRLFRRVVRDRQKRFRPTASTRRARLSSASGRERAVPLNRRRRRARRR